MDELKPRNDLLKIVCDKQGTQVLFLLDNEDGIGVRELTRRMGASYPLTRKLGELEEVELLIRQEKDPKTYERRVYLTSKGKDYIKLLKAFYKSLEDLF